MGIASAYSSMQCNKIIYTSRFPRTIARLPMIKIRHVGYCFSSVASVSSGRGDPPCFSSGIVSCCGTGVPAKARFRGGRRLAALAGRRLPPVRRLAALRRLVVDRRFEVLRHLAGVLFFPRRTRGCCTFLTFRHMLPPVLGTGDDSTKDSLLAKWEV